MAAILAEKSSSRLKMALVRARSGDTALARELLRQIVKQEPSNTHAWVWLAYVAASVEEKRAALRRAHHVNPHNTRVHNALLHLMNPPHVAEAARSGVYVSYARPDELFALDVTETLRAAGVNVWLDMTDIPHDADWHSAVDAALRSCGVMLALLSPAALRAADIRAEQERFLDAGKIVVPVLHQPCNVSGLEVPYPPIDFRSDFAFGIQQLLKILT